VTSYFVPLLLKATSAAARCKLKALLRVTGDNGYTNLPHFLSCCNVADRIYSYNGQWSLKRFAGDYRYLAVNTDGTIKRCR
jgi:hypothetical protein